MLANPFDGRHNEFDLALIPTLAGALALAVAVAVVARDRRADPSLRGLVLPLGALAAVPLVLYTLVSSNVMLTRYTAVAAPFALVVIGAAIATARARLAVPVALLAAASALYGSLASHRESGRFPDIRSAVQTIADDPRDATTTALAGYPAIGFTYEYYAQRAGLTSVRPERRFPIPGARRTWALSMPAMPRQTVRSTLAASGYRLLAHETFPAGDTVQLALVERSR